MIRAGNDAAQDAWRLAHGGHLIGFESDFSYIVSAIIDKVIPLVREEIANEIEREAKKYRYSDEVDYREGIRYASDFVRRY